MRIATWSPARRCRHVLRASSRGTFAIAALLQLAGGAGGTGSVDASGQDVSAAAGHAAQELAEADGSVDDRVLIADNADEVLKDCPQSDVPGSYTIDENYWTWRSTFTMADGDQFIGSLVRDIFSQTRRITLLDNASNTWAAVEHSGDTLLFFDCNSRPVATLKTTKPGSLFGLPPEFAVATASQDDVVGKTSVARTLGGGVEVTVQDGQGDIFARIMWGSPWRVAWHSPWTVSQTNVSVVDPEAAYASGDSGEIDPRRDPRVLSLLVASRFGSPSNALWIVGPLVEVAVAVILLLLCCGGCFTCVQCCRRDPERGNYNPRATFFQRVFGEDEESEDEPGYCRRGNVFLCCSSKSPAKGYGHPSRARGEARPATGFF